MSRALQRDRLESELVAVRRLLDEVGESLLSRMSLQARARDIETELASLPKYEGTNAEVVLSFEGSPVVAHSVDARFASEALQSFQKLVTAIASRHSRGDLKGSGTFPDTDASRLHVTSVVHGSFGFKLEELERPLFGETALAEAVERSLAVLESSKIGADSFIEHVEEEGPRIRDAAFGFLEVLRKNHAAVRMVSDRHDVSFAALDVPNAVEVVRAVRIAEDEEIIPGVFGGVHIEAMRFEHIREDNARAVYGAVDPSKDWREFQKWQGKRCNALVRVTRTFVGDMEKKRPTYLLLDIQPPG